ncbi:hypothetical protein [Alkalihalobacillus sp. BA299]|uniref:hypothetical protein n=1 Tax=Alkalihalobacillus sp. BA299 TaxID=2815938 RepID=UPI001ADD334F|nr:hypothetical protein [Alkalihalobacillus sp. BA299]
MVFEFNPVKPPKFPDQKIELLPYPKNQVEHLVEQLIKLQKSYDSPNNISAAKSETLNAMKIINKSLEMCLTRNLILKEK